MEPSRRLDRELMQRVARGDEEALALLYDRHAATVYGLALRLTGSKQESEEVVQDVFLRVWQHAARFDDRLGSLGSWLTAVTRNSAIDRLRKKNRRLTTISLSAHMAPIGYEETGVERRLLLDDIQQSLSGLPPTLRQVLELAYFEGLTHREIAEFLLIPMGTVKSRLRQAVERLRDLVMRERACDW